jgi:hypothetical protein
MPQGGASEGDASEFLALTQQLALSSAFGAVQCSFGRCLGATLATPAGGGTSAAGDAAAAASLATPDYVLLARFQDEQLLRSFLECPPVAALLEVRPWLPVLQSQPAVFQAALPRQPLNTPGLTQPSCLPPQGDGRLPLRALWSCALETCPSDSSSSRAVSGGLM